MLFLKVSQDLETTLDYECAIYLQSFFVRLIQLFKNSVFVKLCRSTKSIKCI